MALFVKGDVTIIGNTDQTGDIVSGTIKAKTLIGAHTSGSISGGEVVSQMEQRHLISTSK